MKSKNSFAKAGLVMVFAGIVVKVLSAVYRIPLTRMLGATTMGRYSAIFSIFMPFFSLATGGVATCIAHFTAQCNDINTMAKIKRQGIQLYTMAAAVLTLLFVLFGKIYSAVQTDDVFFAGCLVLSPAIILAAAENVFKGTTQGQMDMLPTAKAAVLEGMCKTAFGLGAVWLVKTYYPGKKEDMAVLACLAAVTLSGAVCALYIGLKSRLKTAQPKDKTKTVTTKQMFKLSGPIAVSALTVSLANFFDTAFCLPRIDKIPYKAITQSFGGASFKGAQDITMYLFGIWQGMAVTVFNLVPAIIVSVGVAGIPFLSKSWLQTDKTLLNRHTNKLFSATSAISVPAMFYIFLFAGDILQFLFGKSTAQTIVAVQLLRILCLSGVFCCFNSVFNAVFYAAEKSQTVFKILLLASGLKMTIGYILCGVEKINIKAFAVSTCIFYTIIFVLSLKQTKKLGVAVNWFKILVFPLLSALLSALVVNWLCNTQFYALPLFFRLLFSGSIFCLIYLLVLILTGFFVDK